MTIADPLFESERLRLASPEPEKDAETEARWTHDADYLRLLTPEPARPVSPTHIKKRYEEQAKEKDHRRLAFAIRLKADDRLIGFARLENIEWNNGVARLVLGLGTAEDRRQGYGSEALQLILRYAFHELNLHRLNAETAEYNPGAQRWLEKAGFQLEVRQRQCLYRDGRRWDALWFGLLRPEWEAGHKEQGTGNK